MFPLLCRAIGRRTQLKSSVEFGKSIMRLSTNMSRSTDNAREMKFHDVVKKLNDYAPLHLAGGWDNVGLLVEPSTSQSDKIDKVLVTNDLTEKVVDEAITEKVQFIISYHPPIFVPLKRLCNGNWKQRIITQCIENKIAIYSPHTALDAVEGGVNDWLIKVLDVSNVKPLEESKTRGSFTHKLEFDVPYIQSEQSNFLQSLDNLKDFYGRNGYQFKINCHPDLSQSVSCRCCEQDLAKIVTYLNQDSNIGFNLRITKLEEIPIPGHGYGRIGELQRPVTIQMAVDKIKRYLKLDHVRLALAKTHNRQTFISKFAVCAGSGASVLKGVAANLILTGEMSHHEVLEFNHNGSSVILCDHSNTERGYLERYACDLQRSFQDQVKVIVSTVDSDPLMVI